MARWITSWASAPGVSVAIRLVIGIGVLGALVAAVGARDVTVHLQAADQRWLLPAFLLYAASILARGIRWRVLLRPLDPGGSWAETGAISTLGWSLNNVLPFRLGDLVRPSLISLRRKLSIASLLPSLVAERLLDVLVLLSMLGGGLLLLGLPLVIDAPALGLGVLAMGLLFLVGAYWFPWRKPLESQHPLLRLPLIARLIHTIQGLGDAWRNAVRSWQTPSIVGWAAALTILAWGFQALQYATFFRAFGVDIHPMAFLVGFSAFMFTFAVNFVPGQIGTFEVLFLATFGAFNLAEPDLADFDVLLAIALATHGTNIVALSVLGLISYLKLGVSWSTLQTSWSGARDAGRAA